MLGRRAWLFCGSDDHAKSTAALYSIVCSARLHGIEPEDPQALAEELGSISIPVEPLDTTVAAEQAAS